MRKINSMRAATLLLALTLVTSCFVSGTFAKYVTSDSASDTARVAKFGVVLTATDNSGFATEYATHDDNYSGTLSVKSSDEVKVVAPGTSSADLGNSQTYGITGTPEVATKVDIAMEVTEDIWLLKEDDQKYYPVVFTLKQGDTVVATGNLEAIKSAVETYAADAYYAPNTDLAASFDLSWAWAFESGTQETDEDGNATGIWSNDEYDTILGDLAADVNPNNLVEGTDYNLDIDYTITFTVTQVD